VIAMPGPVKPRAYRSPVREERARANRESVLREAHRLFLERGYGRTSVAAVAQAAGVSEDLVYKLFGTKRGLVVVVLNFGVTGRYGAPMVLHQARPRQVREETDQHRQLQMFAEDISERTSRARPVDDVIRSAGEVDPALAAKRTEMHQERLANLRAFVGWVRANGPLRAGLDDDTAAATVWTVTGPEVHRLLVDDLGWDHDRYRAWVHATLEAALLP
jgi:AcrR family transcriptional regulator